MHTIFNTIYVELLASRIFGDFLLKCNWQFPLKMQLAKFLIAVLSNVWNLQPKIGIATFNLAIFMRFAKMPY